MKRQKLLLKKGDIIRGCIYLEELPARDYGYYTMRMGKFKCWCEK